MQSLKTIQQTREEKNLQKHRQTSFQFERSLYNLLFIALDTGSAVMAHEIALSIARRHSQRHMRRRLEQPWVTSGVHIDIDDTQLFQ